MVSFFDFKEFEGFSFVRVSVYGGFVDFVGCGFFYFVFMREIFIMCRVIIFAF